MNASSIDENIHFTQQFFGPYIDQQNAKYASLSSDFLNAKIWTLAHNLLHNKCCPRFLCETGRRKTG